ncbi:MAG: helix-turn-helix domain-containing protein [Candidatus Dormibacteraceae bacterium]
MPFAYSETPEHVRTTMGAILRRHREQRERTLADIAVPAGISPAHLSEVERGRSEISTERLLKLATALEVTVAGVYLELARELGAEQQLLRSSWDPDPRSAVQRMCGELDREALQTVARFTSFLVTTEGAQRRRIGFLESTK